MKKRLKKMLVWSIFLLIFGIAGLELYTSNCNCTVIEDERANLIIPICENGEDAYPFNYDLEQGQLITEIKEKRSNGEAVTKEEYQAAIDLLVYPIAPEQLGPANGVVCRGGIAYVDESLPTQARLFVARHELEHLFQTTSELDFVQK